MTSKGMPSLCTSCANLFEDGESCEAFPRAIPDDILYNGADHRKPIKGDHGILYKKMKGEEESYQEWLDFTKLRQDKP